MRSNYERYMASDHWRARRDAYWRTHRKQCSACRSTDDVQLHHHTYARMGAELDSDLVPLCQVCHSLVHEYHRVVGGSLTTATFHVISKLKRRCIAKKPDRSVQVGRNNPLDKAFGKIRVSRGARLASQGFGQPIK